jgi:uncharacterized membrane protein
MPIGRSTGSRVGARKVTRPVAASDSESVKNDEDTGASVALEPVIENLPPEQRDAVVRVIESRLSHSGPLPPPEQLSEYDRVLPGLAERIVKLTEAEQRHRHEIVDLAVRRDARIRERGQALAMVALIVMVAFCCYLVATDNAQTAGVVAVGVIAAVVGIFVTGRKEDTKERLQEQGDDAN